MLTEEELRAIRAAAEEAYDKLRWIVGDSENLLAELHILARDSYCAGKNSISLPMTIVVTTPVKHDRAAVSGTIA